MKDNRRIRRQKARKGYIEEHETNAFEVITLIAVFGFILTLFIASIFSHSC